MIARYPRKICLTPAIIRLYLGSALLLFILLAPSSGSAEEKGVLHVADGKGTIHFLWQPSLDFFPDRGWQLVDTTSNKIVKTWKAGERGAQLRKTSPEKVEQTLAAIDSLPTLASDQNQKRLMGLLTISILLDFDTAKALGFGCSIKNERGARDYRLDLLDANNKVLSTVWQIKGLDGWLPSPGPHPPKEVKASSAESGVALFWQPSKDQTTPIISYRIERKRTDGLWAAITSSPLLIQDDADESIPHFTDINVPLEETIYYRVAGVDVFGRLSPFVELSLFHADQKALASPANLVAKTDNEQVKLSWSKHENPFTSGYVLERAMSNTGKFIPLTPQGLSADTTTFDDNKVIGGITYYYRLRAVGPRGDLGSPTDTVLARPLPSETPPKPEKLQTLEVTPIKVTLAWAKPEKPVAGFIVEKRNTLSEPWGLLTSSLHVLNTYEDSIRFDSYGTCYYRVTAIGFNDQRSKPSKVIEVKLPGHAEIPRPHLQNITSEGDSVFLSFKATGNKDLTDHFLIVRGNTIDDLGLVITKPIPGRETTYRDEMVQPGEDYWYSLIALDENGNRSKMSDKLLIRVKSAEIVRADKPDCKYQQEPFPHVAITFTEPPGLLLSSVLRKTKNQAHWLTIADNVRGTGKVIDADPPRSGSVSYSVVYKTENGIYGELSTSNTIDIK